MALLSLSPETKGGFREVFVYNRYEVMENWNMCCFALCRISNFVYPRLSDSVLQYYSTYLQWSWSVEMLARITNKVRGMFWRLNLRTGTVWHYNADACKIQLKHFPPQRDMASV